MSKKICKNHFPVFTSCRFYGRMNRTLTAIKDDFSKLRLTTPQSPLSLLNNIVAPRQKTKNDAFRPPRRPSHVLELGAQDNDYLAEQAKTNK